MQSQINLNFSLIKRTAEYIADIFYDIHFRVASITTLFFIIANVVAILFFEEHNQRVVKFLTGTTFFLLCLFYLNRKLDAKTLVFLFAALSDGFIIFFENEIMASFALVSKIIYSTIIMFYVFPIFNEVLKDKKQLLLFTVIAGIDVTLFRLLARTQDFLKIEYYHELLLCVQIVVQIFLLMISFSYVLGHYTKTSVALLIVVFSFLCSDFFGLIAYYVNMYDFYLADRFFYSLGLGCYLYLLTLPNENSYFSKFLIKAA